MLTGTPFEDLVKSKVPDVGNFTYFNNMSDIILALKSEKTDAVLSNNAVSQLCVNREPETALFPEPLKDSVFGLAFAKGSPQNILETGDTLSAALIQGIATNTDYKKCESEEYTNELTMTVSKGVRGDGLR